MTIAAHASASADRSGARRLFYPAALFNWAIGLPLMAAPQHMARLIGLRPIPSEPVYAQIMFAAIALFGLMYFLAGWDPAKYRPYVYMGIVGKLLTVLLIYANWIAGRLNWVMPFLVTFDAIWALAFWAYLRRSRAPVALAA
jgi:hypothetical protein